MNYWLLGFVSLNVNQQLLNANIAIPLNSPRGFVLWIINHQFTIIDENFKILKARAPQRRFQITTHPPLIATTTFKLQFYPQHKLVIFRHF